jgi:hypothetical protein
LLELPSNRWHVSNPSYFNILLAFLLKLLEKRELQEVLCKIQNLQRPIGFHSLCELIAPRLSNLIPIELQRPQASIEQYHLGDLEGPSIPDPIAGQVHFSEASIVLLDQRLAYATHTVACQAVSPQVQDR